MPSRVPLRVAAAQPAVDPDDLAATVAAHADAVRRAAGRLVVFPELSLTGYAMDAPPVDPRDPVLHPLVAACRETGSTALAGAPVAVRGGTAIGVLGIDASGARPVYEKMSLGGPEVRHFVPGTCPGVVAVDGWRVGLGVCKDTRITGHLEATAALGIDLYAAGVVHLPGELHELDVRAGRIARDFGVPVVLAGFAGPMGGGFAETSGGSGVWDATGALLARCGPEPGEVVTAALH